MIGVALSFGVLPVTAVSTEFKALKANRGGNHRRLKPITLTAWWLPPSAPSAG